MLECELAWQKNNVLLTPAIYCGQDFEISPWTCFNVAIKETKKNTNKAKTQ